MDTRSGGADPLAVFPAVTVTEAVIGAGADPGRPAVVDATSGRVLTYAELVKDVGAAAAGLAAQGVAPGTVVGVHLPDSPEFAVATHAVMAAGAVPLPLRATLSAAELTRLLRAGGARALITWPVLLDIAREAAEPTGVDRLFCFGEEPGAEPFGALLAHEPAAVPLAGAVADLEADPAMLACTRGTAAPARVVALGHAELVAGLVRVAAAGMIGPRDIVLSALPFSGALGFNGVLNPALRLGATVVAGPAAGRRELMRAMEQHGVTVVLVPPRTVETFAYDRAVSGYRLHALRSVVSVGGPLNAEVARACAVRLHCAVRQAYGLTETAGITHLNRRPAEEGTLDSVGPGLPGVEWRIVDAATGRDQPSYQPGEMCVRIPATGTAGRAHARWLRTGDAAFRDEHGRAYILGRLGEGRSRLPGRDMR
ncbi:AMP-binding protein [Actinomadura sp. SCN-SB]|uniref:AMP-binding protein n=1 Tax=Actinomadura sp. SCN-SB TaxID=3373092 RepID=UPI003751E387